jgi:ribonuclease HII
MPHAEHMTAHTPKRSPDLSRERKLWRSGVHRVAGLDEAGRGAWAGPLSAAAVILPFQPPPAIRARLIQVRDSKQMTAIARAAAAEQIRACAQAWSIGAASAAEVDRLGPVCATRLAMSRALAALSESPDHLLIDYLSLTESQLPQNAFPHGDACCLSIAAASVLAKVWRDGVMLDLERQFPGYGFAKHKGYGTRMHAEALDRLGICPEHRLSYAPIRRRKNYSADGQPV